MNRLHVAAVAVLCSLGACETSLPSDAGTDGGGSSLLGGGTGGGGIGQVGGGIGGGQAVVADAGSATSWVLVSGTGPVRVYALDLATGALVPKGLADAGLNPSFLAVDPARRNVYAVNEGGVTSTVSALSFNSKTGALTPLNSAVVGSGPAHLAVDPTGAWVLAANYNGGSVVAVPVRPTGGVGAVKTTVQPGSQPHQIVIDSTTHSAFVPCKGSDSVAQYRFEPDGGS